MGGLLIQINDLKPHLKLLEIGQLVDSNQTQKWNRREVAILIWQAVSNFYDLRGYNESKQMEAVIKCLKDILDLNDNDISKLALDSQTYVNKIEDWLKKNSSDWSN